MWTSYNVLVFLTLVVSTKCTCGRSRLLPIIDCDDLKRNSWRENNQNQETDGAESDGRLDFGELLRCFSGVCDQRNKTQMQTNKKTNASFQVKTNDKHTELLDNQLLHYVICKSTQQLSGQPHAKENHLNMSPSLPQVHDHMEQLDLC